MEDPTLHSLYFDKDFILYNFASDYSATTMLKQKYEVGDDFLISFIRTGLQGIELNYPTIDKQAFVVFKFVKHFRPYLLRTHTKVIVPHTVVRSLLIQKYLGDRRGNWMTTLQEYDLEIKPSKLMNGQGLCKLAT